MAPFLSTGSIKEKNVDVLLKDVALLKTDFFDIMCCVIGNWPEKAGLLIFTKKLAICYNVEFAGFQELRCLSGNSRLHSFLYCLQAGRASGWL